MGCDLDSMWVRMLEVRWRGRRLRTSSPFSTELGNLLLRSWSDHGQQTWSCTHDDVTNPTTNHKFDDYPTKISEDGWEKIFLIFSYHSALCNLLCMLLATTSRRGQSGIITPEGTEWHHSGGDRVSKHGTVYGGDVLVGLCAQLH